MPSYRQFRSTGTRVLPIKTLYRLVTDHCVENRASSLPPPNHRTSAAGATRCSAYQAESSVA
jgi:hypothetical protein